MNYSRIYEELCGGDMDGDYLEKHHIIPRCMGGTDDKNNIVLLTGRAHYIAHLLLIKMYPNNPWLRQVLFYFDGDVDRFGPERIIRNSRLYETNRIAHSENMRINNPSNSAEVRKKQSDYMLNNNPMKNPLIAKKVGDVRREKFKTGELTPRSITEEEKRNISLRMRGDNNPSRRFPDRIQIPDNKGRRWFNDGTNNINLPPGEAPPVGFVPGCLQNRKKH